MRGVLVSPAKLSASLAVNPEGSEEPKFSSRASANPIACHTALVTMIVPSVVAKTAQKIATR